MAGSFMALYDDGEDVNESNPYLAQQALQHKAKFSGA
jgi:hypothetical protein